MKENSKYYLVIILLLGFLVSCTSARSGGKAAGSDDTSVANSPTVTLAPPTMTPTPQPTPTPTQTQMPTFTPTVTPYAFYPDGAVISSENIEQLEKYEILSRGSIIMTISSGNQEQILVQTRRGFFIYDSTSLADIGFYENYGYSDLLPDGSTFAAVGPESNVQIINFESGDIQQTINIENAVGINLISFSRDGHLMAVAVTQPHKTRIDYTSNRIDVYDLQSEERIAVLESDVIGNCSRIAFSETGAYLISSCIPSEFGYPWVINWNISEQSMAWSVRNGGYFPQYPFSPDDTYVFTIDGQETVVRWAANGNEVSRVQDVVGINAFSPDGHYFVTSKAGYIRVWNVTNSQSVKRISTGLTSVYVSYSDDGEYILANNGELAWRVSDYKLDESYPKPDMLDQHQEFDISKLREKGHLQNIHDVIMLPDNTLLVWGYTYSNELWWWYPDQDIYHEMVIGNANGEPALSPFLDQFAICTTEGLGLIDLESKAMEIVANCRTTYTYLAFSGDGKTIFSNYGTVINQIDLETGEYLRQLRGHTHDIGKIKISDDGSLLFSVSAGPTGSGFEAAVWGLDPYTLLKKWTIPAARGLDDALFSVNGEEVIAIMDEITVWRISDGWYLTNLTGSSMALSPDGTLAGIGIMNTGFAFYDTADWSFLNPQVESLEGYASDMPIEYLQYLLYNDTKLARFLDDGQIMVSVNSDDVIELWHIP